MAFEDLTSTGASPASIISGLQLTSANISDIYFGLCYDNPGGDVIVSNELPWLNGYVPRAYFYPTTGDFFGPIQFPPTTPTPYQFKAWREGPRTGFPVISWTATGDWDPSKPVRYWFLKYEYYYIYPWESIVNLFATGQFKHEKILKTGDILEIPTNSINVTFEQQNDF